MQREKRRNTEQFSVSFLFEFFFTRGVLVKKISNKNETENPKLKANNTESLIICHCAFSFIVIVCCKKSTVLREHFRLHLPNNINIDRLSKVLIIDYGTILLTRSVNSEILL